MGILKKDFKYKVINNFLSEDEINLTRQYCILKHTNNRTNFDLTQSQTGDTYFYGDPLIESLMVKKLNLMEKESGLELLPTYSFWRMYTKFADLKKHKDRPACECSVTVMIGSDGTSWPIFIGEEKFDLKPGQAAMYWGTEVTHWREEFQGDWHAQCFIHYVDKNGPYADQHKDGRPILGGEKK